MQYLITHLALRTKAKLKYVNKILLKECGPLLIFQTSKDDDTIKGREHLLNHNQNICFWPVDYNTDPNDPNITVLRQVLIKAIVKDPLDYLNDHIPLSRIKLIDDLVDLSEEVPVMQLYSDDNNDPSIVGLMRKYNTLV